mgnify:CR=1 FL=1
MSFTQNIVHPHTNMISFTIPDYRQPIKYARLFTNNFDPLTVKLNIMEYDIERII